MVSPFLNLCPVLIGPPTFGGFMKLRPLIITFTVSIGQIHS